MIVRCLLALALAAPALPALADAVTYEGTLGKTHIFVELSEPVEAAGSGLFGRYAYASKGIDIPLDAVAAKSGRITLTEERPCVPSICEPAFDAQLPLPQELQGATWKLETSDDGQTLTGTWTEFDKAPLPIKLTYVGARPLDASSVTMPELLAELPYGSLDGEDLITLETAPYDVLRSNAKLVEGPEIRWDAVAFRYLSDPRSKFGFPRVTDLGGASLDTVNATLESRQRLLTLDALNCEAKLYYGMGWTPMAPDFVGSFGGYPDETVEVTYLSPTVMSWTESGSLYCGSAYPDNHDVVHNLDVRTGRNLDLALIFKDSPPSEYGWTPSQALIDYVTAHRVIDDADWDAECGIADLIATNLGVAFRQGDIAVFTLQGLPHAIMACGGELLSEPLAELRPFLTAEASTYFPALTK